MLHLSIVVLFKKYWISVLITSHELTHVKKDPLLNLITMLHGYSIENTRGLCKRNGGT